MAPWRHTNNGFSCKFSGFKYNCGLYTKPKSRMLSYTEIKKAKFYNLTGRPNGLVYSKFPPNLVTEKIIALPDFSPGRAPLPTGSCVVINTEENPGWRRLAISDVGCGIALLRSNISWEDFDENLNSWDELGRRLRRNKGKLGDLGSGNHFLDAVVDPKDSSQRVNFVIHTGSRNESPKVERYLNNPSKFDQEFERVRQWAQKNRLTVSQIVGEVYPDVELVFDTQHNFYDYSPDQSRVTIYKGAVKLEPGRLSIIPSSLDGDMVVVEGKPGLENLEYAINHGTGRIQSRGESKRISGRYDMAALRRRVYIPAFIKDLSVQKENPSLYRSLDEALSRVEKIIEVKRRLTPIAYLGQL